MRLRVAHCDQEIHPEPLESCWAARGCGETRRIETVVVGLTLQVTLYSFQRNCIPRGCTGHLRYRSGRSPGYQLTQDRPAQSFRDRTNASYRAARYSSKGIGGRLLGSTQWPRLQNQGGS